MIGLKLVDRYIANEFWQPLLFGIGIVTGVWFGADLGRVWHGSLAGVGFEDARRCARCLWLGTHLQRMDASHRERIKRRIRKCERIHNA